MSSLEQKQAQIWDDIQSNARARAELMFPPHMKDKIDDWTFRLAHKEWAERFIPPPRPSNFCPHCGKRSLS